MTVRAEPIESSLIVETKGAIRILKINRPERRNALDNRTAEAISKALSDFEDDDVCSVAILTGVGGYFCAGADLLALAEGEAFFPWGSDPRGPCSQLLSKPVIAAVEGYACAGGLGLALRCDLRVAAEGAKFAVLSRRWGVPMSDGTTVNLPRLIGRGRALDMLLCAREVDAEEALAIGLAEYAAPKGEALQVALELAERIAGFPQGAVRADKSSVWQSSGMPLRDALMLETEISARARDLDAQAGARKFASGLGRHGQTHAAALGTTDEC